MPTFRLPSRRVLAVIGGVVAVTGIALSLWVTATYEPDARPSVTTVPRESTPLAVGRALYLQHCASCHGANLEGQPNWRERRLDGRMPAPPHDATGHTWHHPDDVLFGITKYGLVPGKYAPSRYQSDMPAFGGVLTDDEIRGVLAYIESQWPPQVREARAAMTRRAAETQR